MKLMFTELGWDDYTYWQTHNKQVFKKLNTLIKDVLRDPVHGLGKPERLKESLSGFWSRRVTLEHRLVYAFDDEKVVIHQCRFHYSR